MEANTTRGLRPASCAAFIRWVIESTETLKIAATIAGTQGEFDVLVSFVALDVRDTATVWPAA